MSKWKFITGTILSVLSVVGGVGAICFLYSGTHVEVPPEVGGAIGAAGAAVILIVMSVIFLGIQFILGIVAEVFLWINFKRGGFARTASMIIAIICAAVMAASLGYLAVSEIISKTQTQSVALNLTNIVRI